MERNIRKAPTGQFRVIGMDTPGDQGWKQGDYSTLPAAKKASLCGHTIHFLVYNDEGECVHHSNVSDDNPEDS